MLERSTPEILLEKIRRNGPEEIRELRGKPEDLYLDFTTKREPDKAAPHPDDTHNFGKALSGFANSDGGLLIWGIDARKEKTDPDSADVARRFIPLRILGEFVAHLDNLFSTLTKPAVPGVLNLPVEERKGSNSGFVVSYVPVGSAPPYRLELNVHRYYKRSGGRFSEMEPYELRDVIFRFRYPKIQLEISDELVFREGIRDIYSLRMKLSNFGPTTLKNHNLVVWLPKSICHGAQNLEEVGEEDREGRLYKGFAYRSLSERNWVFPGQSKHVVEQKSPSALQYFYDPTTKPGRETMALFWELYGEDMPRQNGRMTIADIVRSSA